MSGCGIQDRYRGTQARHEDVKTLTHTRGDRKDTTVYGDVRLPACPTCGAPPNSRRVLEVDVELPDVLSKTKHSKGKLKSSNVKRRIREARRVADPPVGLERIRQSMGYTNSWSEMTAGFYGISPP